MRCTAFTALFSLARSAQAYPVQPHSLGNMFVVLFVGGTCTVRYMNGWSHRNCQTFKEMYDTNNILASHFRRCERRPSLGLYFISSVRPEKVTWGHGR